MSVYVVDSNFFIQAHRMTYPIDVVPSYWKKVEQLAAGKKLISIDKVKNEIFGHNDILEDWCRNHLPSDFFADSSGAIDQYKRIVEWALTRQNHYLPKAINEFLEADSADAFIIAFALADLENRIVLTQETRDIYRKNKIKIPEVCAAFGIAYVNTIEMLRQLKETF